MVDKVLILGGYGNFGSRIAKSLAEAGICVILAGRDKEKIKSAAQKIRAEYIIWQMSDDFAATLKTAQPKVAINTCGPFQNHDYRLPEICAQHGTHYIDLADGRDYVCNITKLDALAKASNILVVSGASTVPGLSTAVIEKVKSEFSVIESLRFGITPGQKTQRGLATAKSILTYLGKPIKPSADGNKRFGWQDLYRQNYPELGTRWMANCDIPDLDLLPEKYGIKSVHFSAGLEVGLLHLGMWAISWLVRLGLPVKLENHASLLLKLSDLFNAFGTKDGGMHMIFIGQDHNLQPLKKSWFIIAKNGDGPQIPCVPAIVLTKKILSGEIALCGAHPCLGLLSLEEYMQELSGLEIKLISY